MNDNKKLRNFIENWLKNLKNSKFLSNNSIIAYNSDLHLFITFLEGYYGEVVTLELFCKISKKDLRSWFLKRKNQDDSARSLSRALSSIKSFVKYLIDEKIIEYSDIIYMKPPKREKTLPRPLNISQINNILDASAHQKQTDWIIKRDKAFLIFTYSVGLRISETLSILKKDFIDCGDFLNIKGKGDKIRNIPIIIEIRQVVNEYLNSCPFNDALYLFVNKFGNQLSASAVQKLVKNSRKFLGLSENVTPHSLRHSCATHLVESGQDIRSVQKLLGHSSISSTQIYSQVAQQYVSETYDNCHPLSKLNFELNKKNSN